DKRVSRSHEGANRRGGCVENADFMLLDHLPKTTEIGLIGGSLVHENRRCILKGPVDHVAMACHPSDVGGGPVNIVFLQIEDPFRRESCAKHVAGCCVNNPFWLPRGAAGVEDVEEILAFHRFRSTFRLLLGNDFMPPNITAVFHWNGILCSLKD